MDKLKQLYFDIELFLKLFYWKWSKRFFDFMDEMDKKDTFEATCWNLLFNIGIFGVLFSGVGVVVFGVTYVIMKMSLWINVVSLWLFKLGLYCVLVGLVTGVTYWLIDRVKIKLDKSSGNSDKDNQWE